MANPLFHTVADAAIPVSALNSRVRALLENSFSPLWVSGEVSNLTRHASGHWYFSLKDDKAQVRCVMFRHRNQYVDFTPKNGMQVEARALVSLYEPRGDFQLNIEALRPGGLGALYAAFAALKAKLEAEGLFDPARKKPLPAFPAQIGIITSPQAAALRDVLSTLRRRMPGIPVVLYPTPVQGRGACLSIAQAIQTAGKRDECDVLILCRGGGSIEDLWEFNEEIVARAIAASAIPMVCGVGHETDFTIADFAADLRAPTPTAAAELASPNRADLFQRVAAQSAGLTRNMRRIMESRMQHLDHLSKRLLHPGERLRQQRQQLGQSAQRLARATRHLLDQRSWQIAQWRHHLLAVCPDLATQRQTQSHLATRLAFALQQQLQQAQQRVTHLTAHLTHLNPQAVLARGYSIVRDERGQVVRESATISVGEEVAMTFAAGTARASVISK